MKPYIVINAATDMIMSQHEGPMSAWQAAGELANTHHQRYDVLETKFVATFDPPAPEPVAEPETPAEPAPSEPGNDG